MKQNVILAAIISGSICFIIGFGSGALLTRPNREKTKSAITTIEAKTEAKESTIPPSADLTGMVWVSINEEDFSGQMSKYETTNAQYCQFLNAAKASNQITVLRNVVYASTSPSQPYYDLDGKSFTGDGKAARINYDYGDGMFSVDSRFENHPVAYVSWYGAIAFCNYYSYRLPTKSEWEAVADFDGSFTYGCGKTINNSIANCIDSTHPYGTTPVGAFGEYGYGMCDMAGNVSEMTSSVDGGITDCLRVVRGGSCLYDAIGYTVDLSYDVCTSPEFMSEDVGFRVCR